MKLEKHSPKLVIEGQGDSSVLFRKAEPIDEPETQLQELQLLALEMARIMYDNGGIGLAAPQAGLGARIITLDCGSGLTALANPVILKLTGEFTSREGCLSFPGKLVDVKRAKLVKLRAFDISKGKVVTLKYRGLESACIQHEIDHLEGVCVLSQ